MLDTILNALSGQSWVSLASHMVVGSAWAVALFNIWKARAAPMSHQAFAAACAIVLGEFTLIFQNHIPQDAMVFFLALAQLVMAISVVKLFHWSLDLMEQHPETFAPAIKLHDGRKVPRKEIFRTYGMSIGIAIAAGALYVILNVIESLHGQ